jgi:hypothetical protein
MVSKLNLLVVVAKTAVAKIRIHSGSSTLESAGWSEKISVIVSDQPELTQVDDHVKYTLKKKTQIYSNFSK